MSKPLIRESTDLAATFKEGGVEAKYKFPMLCFNFSFSSHGRYQDRQTKYAGRFSDDANSRLSSTENMCTREKMPSFCVDLDPGKVNWLFCLSITQSLFSDEKDWVLAVA